MAIQNALAGIAVKELNAAAGWYEKLVGSAGKRPMPEVAEWTFPSGGCLQVFTDKERAGKSSMTLAVGDIDAEVKRLEAAGMQIGKRTDTNAVRTVIVADPDGNRIVLAQALTGLVAR